jgi:hypothetical protein
MIGTKRKAASRRLFQNSIWSAPGATDELFRSLKLDHIDAGQRDLVND